MHIGLSNTTDNGRGDMGKSSNSSNDDNRANQLNPNNDAYWSSRGQPESDEDRHQHNNRSNQLNPNNRAFWASRRQFENEIEPDYSAKKYQENRTDHLEEIPQEKRNAATKKIGAVAGVAGLAVLGFLIRNKK